MTRYPEPPGHDEWAATVPDSIKRDPVWRNPAYRYGLMAADLAKRDVQRLRGRRSQRAIDQLLDAVDGISANIADGFGKSSGPDRARFYEIALGSAREARDWYWKARPYLDSALIDERCELLTRIVRILTALIPRERSSPPLRPRKKEDGADDGEPK